MFNPGLLAKEIQIVTAERILAAKFVAAEATVAQPAPHELFRPRFNLAKLAGALGIGHDGNLRNRGKAAKLVLLSALTCFLSPGERISAITLLVYSDVGVAHPVAGFSEGGRSGPG
jgi:hypothetical protein